MMTFKEMAKGLMVDRGMWPDQASQVLEQMMKAPENSAMVDRWEDDVSDYPSQMTSLIKCETKKQALVWIDANQPLAFFRPMFLL